MKYLVDLDAVSAAFPSLVWRYLDASSLHYYMFQIVCIARLENDDNSYLVVHVPGKIIHYNLKRKTFLKICDVLDPGENEEFHMDGVFQHVESFCYV